MYCLINEIRQIFEENEVDGDPPITDAEISSIITDVDTEIDAALCRRYITPFSSVPQLISTISRLKSTAETMRRIYMEANGALIKPEVMNHYRNEGNRLMEDLRTGRLEITGSRRLQMSATTL